MENHNNMNKQKEMEKIKETTMYWNKQLQYPENWPTETNRMTLYKVLHGLMIFITPCAGIIYTIIYVSNPSIRISTICFGVFMMLISIVSQ